MKIKNLLEIFKKSVDFYQQMLYFLNRSPKMYEKQDPELREKGRWTAKHEQVLEMTYSGNTIKEIADEVQINALTVKEMQNSGTFKSKLTRMGMNVRALIAKKTADKITKGRAREFLDTNQFAAARKIVELLDSESEQIALKAAQDILDRTGLRPIEIVEQITRNYTPEEVERAKTTMVEAQNIFMRLETKDSKFLLSARKQTLSSSATDKGSDAPTQESQSPST